MSNNARYERLCSLLSQAGLDALALNPGPSLSYLTGIRLHLFERPIIYLAAPPREPVLVLPALEAGKAQQSTPTLQCFTYGDNPEEWPLTFAKAATALQLDGKKIGVEPERLRLLELRYLEAAMAGAQFIPAGETLAHLRMQKDEQELVFMRRAVQIAQQALQATLPMVKPGVSEREIAAELTIQLLRAGCDSEMPFAPIVASGPNSANPHAEPSERRIQSGDLLLIDWGAACNGYFSDLTRTFAIGKVAPEFERIARIVMEANAAGRESIRAGATADTVDRAARAVIEATGYGAQFFHRTGHGLGMDIHEPPYMYAGNPLVLQAGMSFTVEPGIYLPGKGGVRIEDNVVVTANGSETLSNLPRELITIG